MAEIQPEQLKLIGHVLLEIVRLKVNEVIPEEMEELLIQLLIIAMMVTQMIMMDAVQPVE